MEEQEYADDIHSPVELEAARLIRTGECENEEEALSTAEYMDALNLLED